MGPPDDGGNGNGGGLDLSSLLPTLTLLSARSGGSTAHGDYHQWLQLLLALLLPLLLRSVLPKLQTWASGFRLHGAQATRIITHTRDPACWWNRDADDDDEAFNAVVQRAILKYINTKLPDVARSWKESDVQVGRVGRGAGQAHGRAHQAGCTTCRTTKFDRCEFDW